jgi:hypothetical protein
MKNIEYLFSCPSMQHIVLLHWRTREQIFSVKRMQQDAKIQYMKNISNLYSVLHYHFIYLINSYHIRVLHYVQYLGSRTQYSYRLL